MAWGSLPSVEAEEIEEAIAMLREAGAQGPACSNFSVGIGILLEHTRKDVDGAEQAFRAAIEAYPNDMKPRKSLGLTLV